MLDSACPRTRGKAQLRSPNSARTEPVDPLIFTTAPGPDGWIITAVVNPAPAV
ncbi:hypothetical protein [Prescottella subtropica]|uniref:hypothetical protein n=1 Tax=Prescottella subtropica TaxID=2545757 RepID=UPI00138687CC|nr:hypothetical protein [Prescottella subtropica]